MKAKILNAAGAITKCQMVRKQSERERNRVSMWKNVENTEMALSHSTVNWMNWQLGFQVNDRSCWIVYVLLILLFWHNEILWEKKIYSNDVKYTQTKKCAHREENFSSLTWNPRHAHILSFMKETEKENYANWWFFSLSSFFRQRVTYFGSQRGRQHLRLPVVFEKVRPSTYRNNNTKMTGARELWLEKKQRLTQIPSRL